MYLWDFRAVYCMSFGGVLRSNRHDKFGHMPSPALDNKFSVNIYFLTYLAVSRSSQRHVYSNRKLKLKTLLLLRLSTSPLSLIILVDQSPVEDSFCIPFVDKVTMAN